MRTRVTRVCRRLALNRNASSIFRYLFIEHVLDTCILATSQARMIAIRHSCKHDTWHSCKHDTWHSCKHDTWKSCVNLCGGDVNYIIHVSSLSNIKVYKKFRSRQGLKSMHYTTNTKHQYLITRQKHFKTSRGMVISVMKVP